MNDLSRLADMAEIIGVLVVVGGLFFAILQMRQLRQRRREMAAIELFRFFGNPQFAEAYKTVLQLPNNLSASDIRSTKYDVEDAAMLIGTTMENIGVMTYQRIVPFAVVNNLVGTSTVVLWGKLENWARTLREELDQAAAFEWFEWLADRLQQHAPPDGAPAYEAHHDWQPSNISQDI